MSDNSNEKQLNRCLKAMMDAVQDMTGKLEQSGICHADTLFVDLASDHSTNRFTFNTDEIRLMDELKETNEHILQRYLPRLSPMYQNYILNFLHQYDYDDENNRFKDSLSTSNLRSYSRGLRSMATSVDAFRAASEGRLSTVKDFLEASPIFKDKPGLSGTTLLYAAANNGHMPIVKYLIETAKCCVNAQNEQHLEQSLSLPKKTASGLEVDSKAASTALHGALSNGHLSIAQYLVEHGADYFIKNQALDTPLMNARLDQETEQYFQNLLLPGYSKPSNHLPDKPISDEPKQMVDCIWDYKPFNDPEWYKFTSHEAKELQQSLIVLPDQEFKYEVLLKVTRGVYSVSTTQFLRSGRGLDTNNNLAWVRCRGSSILNFDCYCLWQIMFQKHPQAASNASPSLKIFDIPNIQESVFTIQLNAWYNCDTNTNARLDHAMNYRKKLINLTLSFINEQNLIFNLHTFSFANKDKSISGCIRWILKLISNSEDDKNKIKYIDNFSAMTNVKAIPLTTAHHRQVTNESESSFLKDDELFENGDVDDATLIILSNDLDDGKANKSNETTKSSDGAAWTINDSVHDDDRNSVTTSDVSDDTGDVRIDDYFDPNSRLSHLPQSIEIAEKSSPSDKQAFTEKMLEDLQREMTDIAASRNKENQKTQEQLLFAENKTAQSEKQLAETLEKMERLNMELQKVAKTQEKIKEIARIIQTTQYINIQENVIQEFLVPKYELVLDYLKRKSGKLDEFFIDKIPKIVFVQQNRTYTVTLTGMQAHHQAFKGFLQRILTLSDIKQRALDFYQRHLNRITRSINQILFQVQPTTRYWKQYSKFLYELLKAENTQYWTKFKGFISQKIIEQSELFILDTATSPWTEIRRETNLFIAENNFDNEIERLKYQALDKFIELNISYQELKLKKPTKTSIKTIKYFTDKVKNDFKTDLKYIGHCLKHFSLIPQLLQQLMIYYSCFTIQLPLYEHAEELLQKIKENTVISISTSTGSGKSTLLPALLIAEGYEKVIVTQPRRLPCKLISQRVNETMSMDANSPAEQLAGWAISGDEENPRAKILYLTDGLLKERLINNVESMVKKTSLDKPMVFFLDEVHERSVNIDLCLALIARMLTNAPALASKIKVIISSATLDSAVVNLFRRIEQIKFAEFTIPSMGTRYRVEKSYRPTENILTIVQELYQKRQREDQILCFVNSAFQVNQCCKLLSQITQGAIKSYPLIQSQSGKVQEEYIKNGSVFFSTTVAETSLTFPLLRYVVDTGRINIPIYNIQDKRIILKEIPAAESTIKQRLGRLGRTQPGEYYALYESTMKRLPFPKPQICQLDLLSIEFWLRRSPLQKGLDHLKNFLPDKPEQTFINFTTEELVAMDILHSNTSRGLTDYGKSLAKLPDFGSLPMTRCVLAALQDYGCGRDLICLASILSVLNTTSLLKSIPEKLKSSEGDFMTLLNVMNDILLTKQSVPSREFKIQRVCQVKGLSRIQHIIAQALRRYTNLERSFDLLDDYREGAQIQNGDWKFIAKALLIGYSDNVFVSEKDLQGRTHIFIRYSHIRDKGVLHLTSTLTKSINQTPVSLILARDILYLSSVRSTAILSFLGQIKTDWIKHHIERQIKLNNDEETHLNANNGYATARTMFASKIRMNLSHQLLTLIGPAGDVLDAELYLRQQLIIEFKFTLDNTNPPNSAKYENLAHNLESVMKMTRIFKPMIWRWEAEQQIQITINSNTATKIFEIIVKGRDSEVRRVKEEFDSFLSWLQNCAVIRHPNAGVTPRLLRAQMRDSCKDIEERIAHVTDPHRTLVDIYNNVKGSQATRETRMEVVAWIAVCKFDCKLEGGFVRDWIVGKYTARPNNIEPNDWIQYNPNQKIPFLNREVVPADLDCHLPTYRYFDIEKFQDELHKFDIKCIVQRENWRYILLLDRNAPTGPFTMDLIEPHVALTHDRIDFDVNNLVVEKDYTRDLGMRIDIQQKPYSIELETIINNIKTKSFQVLRPIDSSVTIRIKKMTDVRHWKQIGTPFNVLPNPDPKYNAILVPLHHTSTLHQDLSQRMKSISSSIQIISIEEIKNPYLEEVYEGMKKLIGKQCTGNNPNECLLFHGTKDDGITGIVEYGYDDRFFISTGAWGHGAYFADDPRKSHSYATPHATEQTRVMFYNKVLLGSGSLQTTPNSALVSAPKECHSVKGTGFTYTEYIIYRYGQALPHLKIIYKD